MDEQLIKTEEGINDIAPSLKLDIDDDQLVQDINKFLADSATLKEKMDQVGEDNERYWEGRNLDAERVRRQSLKINDPRMWLSLETIIPIATSRTPEPTLRCKDPELRENTKQLLMNLWEVPTDDDASDDMQSNLEMIVRHWGLNRIGILHYWYDPEIDDVRTVWRHPKQVKFDKQGKTVDECRFVALYCDDTVQGLCNKWPSKKTEILLATGRQNPDSSSVTYVEFWTNEYVAYKYLNVILEKKKNPNFDYGDMGGKNDQSVSDTVIESPEVKKQGVYNLFKKPRKPFLTLSVFQLGKTIYDDTSLFDQAKSLQDAINKEKRNITDNAADNGVLVGSGDHIDKKVLESYTGAPDEKLFLKSGNPAEALTRLQPKTMPQYVFNDLSDSKSEIDNIFGTHDTTRGERTGTKTATETQALRQGDMGRIDIISRALDRIAQEWYQAMLHMYLVFKTKPIEINSNDEEGTSIIFNRDEYLNPETGELYKVIIKVKPGSSMSIDKDAQRQEAMELMQGQMIDPISFFERMDYSNPQEMAKRLFYWLDPTLRIQLFPDLAAAQAQQQQQMQVQQQAEQQQVMENHPIEEGTPLNLPAGEPQPNLP